MEAQLARRPAASCCRNLLSTSLSPSSRLLSPALSSKANGGMRQKATASRMKRALNIPPHPSFLTPTGPSTGQNQIIFNPPSSAPTVFHTPFKFLPKTDPRRRANLPSELFASSTTIKYNTTSTSTPPSSSSTTTATKATAKSTPADAKAAATAATEPPLPPKVYPDWEKKYHLTLADVKEIRRLRAEDPVTYSVRALAEKFKCNTGFILIVTQSSWEHRKKIRAAMEAARARWGPRRAAARAERKRRWQMLFRGEI